MNSDFSQTLEHWQNFYLLAGGASATLVGLLFIAVSLHIDLFSDDSELRVREVAEQTLISFFIVLITALVLNSASPSPAGVGLPVLILGIFNIARAISSIIHRIQAAMQHLHGLRDVGRYLLWMLLLPTASLIMIGVALTLLNGDTSKLYWLIWAVIITLISATTNAWNMMIQLAVYKHRRAAHPQSTGAPATGKANAVKS